MGRATPSGVQPAQLSRKLMPSLILCTVLLPKPLRLSSRPAAMAALSSAMQPICSSFQSTWAFLGPSPGMLSSSRMLAGSSAVISSRTAMCPVRRYSSMRAAMVLPMPGTLSNPPAWATSPMSLVRPSTARAARR